MFQFLKIAERRQAFSILLDVLALKFGYWRDTEHMVFIWNVFKLIWHF